MAEPFCLKLSEVTTFIKSFRKMYNSHQDSKKKIFGLCSVKLYMYYRDTTPNSGPEREKIENFKIASKR